MPKPQPFKFLPVKSHQYMECPACNKEAWTPEGLQRVIGVKDVKDSDYGKERIQCEHCGETFVLNYYWYDNVYNIANVKDLERS